VSEQPDAGRHRRPRARVVIVALASGAAIAVAAGGIALRAPVQPPGLDAAAGLAAPVAPAFVPGPPRFLGSTRDVSHWAPVQRAIAARAAPNPRAPVVTSLSTRTPEGTRNAVAVIRRAGHSGWVHVRLPVLPNGTTGWVPRAALGGYQAVRTRLDVDLAGLRATLYRGGRPILRVPIGAGMAGWPTPRGDFYIRNKLTRYRSPAYGPVAFGTSARSPRATDWPAGGYIGIHGTDRPGLIPGRVSHGCIRLRDSDILALASRMPVGTPVRIR
jgi:lipoprotein-anchoring transpeptidase ErfK/SrfK